MSEDRLKLKNIVKPGAKADAGAETKPETSSLYQYQVPMLMKSQKKVFLALSARELEPFWFLVASCYEWVVWGWPIFQSDFRVFLRNTYNISEC